MLSLEISSILFVGIHLFISGTTLRDRLVARLGERGYLGAFSLLSAVTLGWMIWAFGKANPHAPTAVPEYRGVAVVLVFIAFVFVVLGNATRGATAVGGESTLDDAEPVRGIHRVTRHPFLVGIAIWSGTHLLFNPQPPTAWFFGAFFVLALLGPRSIDARRARKLGDRWTRYAAQTSVVPFAAIAQGRNRLVWSEFRAIPLLIAVVAFAAFLALHTRFFGMAPY